MVIPHKINIKCPKCGHEFKVTVKSLNEDMEGIDKKAKEVIQQLMYLQSKKSDKPADRYAYCPKCKHRFVTNQY